MIDARTQLVGLIGWPVEHSLSPVMHNAAFAELGMNWCYLPLPVPPQRVGTALAGLTALGFRGANVTIPHKRSVLSVLSSLSPQARALGAVNTLVIEQDGGRTIRGENTDAVGFTTALGEAEFSAAGSNALIVGSGGGARAAIYALITSKADAVTILSRRVAKAQEIVDSFTVKPQNGTRLRAVELSAESLIDCAADADLLVNATPVGMWPAVERSIWPEGKPVPPHLTVFDLVYNPHRTRLLQQALSSGAGAISGLEMLVQQGARSFAMWTNRQAPIETMRQACKQQLVDEAGSIG